MVHLKDIHFQYESSDFKLNIDNLLIPEQKSTALIGPSGCGKTTLMSLVAGIIPVQSGQIIVNDVQVHQLDDKERRRFRIQNVGFIFQDFALLDYLSLNDNIMHPFRINSALKINEEIKSRAIQLAQTIGIENRLMAYPHRTSQGEKQRAAICRALINQPAVILADEPTANLDPENKKKILDSLFNYIKANKATLIVATHDASLLKLFDQVIELKDLSS